MKKLIAVLTIVAALALNATAQTPTAQAADALDAAVANAQVAAVNTNAATLSQAQVAQVNTFVDGLLPYIPAADIPLAGKIIGYLGVVAVIGRLLKGYVATNGSVTGTLWHFAAGILFNHTPNPPATGANSQGAGARAQRLGLFLCLGMAALLFTGCKSEQMLNNTTGDGVNIHLIVPIPGTQADLISVQLQGGIYKNTSLIQPTSTNKIYTASLAINSKTVQADSVAGNVGGTNTAVATVLAGSRDVNAITTGDATVNDATNTLNATSVQ